MSRDREVMAYVGVGALSQHVLNLILPIAVIASVLVILVPLPSPVIDIMLAANISVAVLVLLTTIYVRVPLEFSVFPTLLLATTLGRLVLNIATTRSILTRAQSHGTMAAGEVIASFGQFVASNRIVVGVIIFVIIVVIQFVVITKGATRISEVAARFALDGMPGRQMAVDADLNAGMIDGQEAQRRRDKITQQADFCAAMDGASKFVRGDALAGIVIILVNLVGGLAIGVLEAGMSLSEASSLFTKLTIGDGLVSQLPALLISLAAGLLVTRGTQRVNLPTEFISQLFSRPQALAVTAAFLGVLIFTSMPWIPLLLIGGGCSGLAVLLSKKQQADDQSAQTTQAKAKQSSSERVEDYLLVDPMELEIGVGLICLADPKRGGDLLDRIGQVRQNMAQELGIIMPKVRIRDNMRLAQNQYQIKLFDIPMAHGEIFPGKVLVAGPPIAVDDLDGTTAEYSMHGSNSIWIGRAERERVDVEEQVVMEPSAVLSQHLTELVRSHADEILTRDATKHLVEELKKNSPAVVEELIPKQMTLPAVQKILRMLLREGIPIRQLAPILETLGDYVSHTKDPILLTEHVRQRLSRTICTRYRDGENKLHVMTLDPVLEDRIRAGFEHNDRGLFIQISPEAVSAICKLIASKAEHGSRINQPPILLVSPEIRVATRQMSAKQLPGLVVLSFNEMTCDTQVESIGLVSENTGG